MWRRSVTGQVIFEHATNCRTPVHSPAMRRSVPSAVIARWKPENRLVARGLEAEWEQRLRDLEQAQSELTRREQQRPRTLTPHERSVLLALGHDLKRVWFSPTTTPRDQKELFHHRHLPRRIPGASHLACIARRQRPNAAQVIRQQDPGLDRKRQFMACTADPLPQSPAHELVKQKGSTPVCIHGEEIGPARNISSSVVGRGRSSFA